MYSYIGFAEKKVNKAFIILVVWQLLSGTVVRDRQGVRPHTQTLSLDYLSAEPF